MSRSRAAGARSSSRACRSRRRCSRAAGSSRAWSGASPPPSAMGWGCSPRGSGGLSRIVTRGARGAGPGSPSSSRGGPARGGLRVRAVLAVRDPQADGGDGLQHPARRRVTVRRGADLLPPPADRARPARPVPLAGEAAQPLDRTARREGGRLGPGGRPHLRGRQRPAAAGLCQPHEQRVLGARHDDRGRGAPAHDQPALGRAGLARAVGFAGIPGPQLHRQGPVGSDIEKFTRQPAMEPIRIYAGLASANGRRPRPRWRSRTSSARAGFSARTCSW